MICTNVLVCLWNTDNLFKINSRDFLDITKKHIEASLFFLQNQNITYKLIVVKDLSEIINYHSYDRYVIIANGTLIFDPIKFWTGVLDHEEDIVSHILEFDGQCTLHEQILIFSQKAFNVLERSDFSSSLNFEDNNYITIERSQENVHDHYTPLWIKLKKTNQPFIKHLRDGVIGTHEGLIKKWLTNEYTIYNVNESIRKSKFYSYHVHKTDEFFSALPTKTCTEDMYAGHRAFFEIFDNSKFVFCYNNETVVKNTNKQLDCFIGVASGYLPLAYLTELNMKPGSHVLLLDTNQHQVNFYKWLLCQPKFIFLKDWSEIVDLSPVSHLYRAGIKDQSNVQWKQLRNKFLKKFDLIKSFNFDVRLGDLVLDEIVTNTLSKYSSPFIWFSNVFSYFENFDKNWKLSDVEYYLHRILKANMNTEWVGIYNKTITSPYPTKGDSFYRKIEIPTFDVNIFLSEIKSLEDNNMFVGHRQPYHPGWEAFTLHGISYSDTEHSDPNNNMWTTEAIEHCPSIINYFTENKIKDPYARVRIMKLLPGKCVNIHNDSFSGKDMWGMNIAINNPRDCIMHFWTRDFEYQGTVPWNPGDCYAIKISDMHMVINNSNEPRYHIIVHGNGHDTF